MSTCLSVCLSVFLSLSLYLSICPLPYLRYHNVRTFYSWLSPPLATLGYARTSGFADDAMYVYYRSGKEELVEICCLQLLL